MCVARVAQLSDCHSQVSLGGEFPWHCATRGASKEPREVPSSTGVVVALVLDTWVAVGTASGSYQQSKVQSICERFRSTYTDCGCMNLPTNFIPEEDEWLLTNMALGHAVLTYGGSLQQYFWYEKCGAYTCEKGAGMDQISS